MMHSGFARERVHCEEEIGTIDGRARAIVIVDEAWETAIGNCFATAIASATGRYRGTANASANATEYEIWTPLWYGWEPRIATRV